MRLIVKSGTGMMDANPYQKNRLEYLKNLLELRSRYRGTPGGFHHEAEEEQLKEEIAALEQQLREAVSRPYIISRYSIPEEVFLGRRKELAQMKEILADTHIVLLSGIGGIGKSALASAYASSHRGEYAQVVCLSCSQSLYQAVTDDAGLDIRGIRFTSGKYRSRNILFMAKTDALDAYAEENRLLFILDDISWNDSRMLEKLIRIPADFILTSRDNAAGFSDADIPSSSEITVQFLNDEEGGEFFSASGGDRLGGESRRQFEAFVEKTGRHPLAMKLWLAAENPEEAAIYSDLSEIILRQGENGRDERKVLMYMSVLPPAGISEQFFLEISGLSESSVRRAVSRRLLSRTENGILVMHSLIRRTILHSLKPDCSKCRPLLMRLADSVSNAWNDEKQVNVKKESAVLSVCRAFPKPVPWMHETFSVLVTFLWVQEYYEEAEGLALSLFDAVVRKYGEPHQVTGEVALRTAAVYHNSMNYGKARDWYARALDNLSACKPVSRQYERRLVSALSRMARVYKNENQYEKALTYLEEGLRHTGMMKEAGNTYAYLQSSYLHRRIAEIRLRRGETRDAEAHRLLMHEEMDRYFSCHRTDEPRLNDMRETDVEFALSRGEYRGALSLLYQSLSVFIRYRGDTHEDTLHCRQMIAGCYSALGDKTASLHLYESVLTTLQEEYPYEYAWQDEITAAIAGIRAEQKTPARNQDEKHGQSSR